MAFVIRGEIRGTAGKRVGGLQGLIASLHHPLQPLLGLASSGEQVTQPGSRQSHLINSEAGLPSVGSF